MRFRVQKDMGELDYLKSSQLFAEKYPRKFARGGRGGQVVKVTKLEDDSSEGTLRWALTNLTGPRTIVFDIGGKDETYSIDKFAQE